MKTFNWRAIAFPRFPRFTTSIIVSDCKLSNRWRKRDGGKADGQVSRREGKEDAREEKFRAAKVREMGEQAREKEKLRNRARSKIKEFAAKRRAPLSRKHSRYLSNRSLMKPVRADPQRN